MKATYPNRLDYMGASTLPHPAVTQIPINSRHPPHHKKSYTSAFTAPHSRSLTPSPTRVRLSESQFAIYRFTHASSLSTVHLLCASLRTISKISGAKNGLQDGISMLRWSLLEHRNMNEERENKCILVSTLSELKRKEKE